MAPRKKRDLSVAAEEEEEIIRIRRSTKPDDEEKTRKEAMAAMGLAGAMSSDDEVETSDDDEALEEEEEEADGVESEEEEDDEGNNDDDRTHWGQKSAAYFQQEQSDSDDAASDDDDDSDHELQLQEARQAKKAQKATLSLADFDVDGLLMKSQAAESRDSEGVEKEVEALLSELHGEEGRRNKTHVESTLQNLTTRQSRAVLRSRHPEFVPLLKDMKEKADELVNRVVPLLAKAEANEFLSSDGVSFIEAKNQLLVTYLQYLAFYLHLKARGASVRFHPVVERLAETRLLLEKFRPIESKLSYQVARLLEVAASANSKDGKRMKVEAQCQEEAVKRLRPRPDRLVVPSGKEEEACIEEEEEECETDEDEDEEEELEGEEVGRKSALYRAPMTLPVEYTGDRMSHAKRAQRELERQRQRMKRSELVDALRGEVEQSAPEELGREDDIQFRDPEAAAVLRKIREREKYEVETLTRVALSKKDRKEMLRLREKQKTVLAKGSTLGELGRFVDEVIDVTTPDPTTGTPSARQGGLASYLNAAKRSSEVARQSLENVKSGDAAVVNKRAPKRRREEDNDLDMGEAVEAEEGAGRIEKDAKKKAKTEALRKRALAYLPAPEETVEGRRGTNYAIEKNKGLTRKRKKVEGNARVHNRLKFSNKLKKMQGMRVAMREGDASGHYEGEASGISTHVTRSKILR